MKTNLRGRIREFIQSEVGGKVCANRTTKIDYEVFLKPGNFHLRRSGASLLRPSILTAERRKNEA